MTVLETPLLWPLNQRCSLNSQASHTSISLSYYLPFLSLSFFFSFSYHFFIIPYFICIYLLGNWNMCLINFVFTWLRGKYGAGRGRHSPTSESNNGAWNGTGQILWSPAPVARHRTRQIRGDPPLITYKKKIKKFNISGCKVLCSSLVI